MMVESGLLLIDKPEGPSSARVVETVKRILRARKVGHLGTLDPFASGLLPLALNEATKVAEIFLAAPKSYAGTIALGVKTDTQDATGAVLETLPVPRLEAAELDRVVNAFTGPLWQTPPMFSALKKDGVRLYRLARQGQTVDRPARSVTVDRLRLWKTGHDEIGFELTCSKGTYIRTLAADMGTFLSCGAHLKSLRRLSCGHLNLDQAVTPDELRELKAKESVPLLPLNEALRHLPEVTVEGPALSRLRSGQQEPLLMIPPPRGREKMIRLVDPKDHLVALAEWAEADVVKGWRLFRTFVG
jgi:tRNA pseudouridine55 synthase